MTPGSHDPNATAEVRIDAVLLGLSDPTAAGRGWKEVRVETLADAETLIELVEATGGEDHQLLFHRGRRCYLVRWR